MRHDFRITPPDAGRRLDRWLQRALGDVPFSLVQRLLRQKKVRVNGERGFADRLLRAGDEVVVHHAAAPSTASRPSPRIDYAGPPIEVLEETAGFLFVRKPAGVACSDDGRDAACVQRWLERELRGRIERGEVRPEPCHRLDRGTTGVLAVALTAAAFDRFRRALEAGSIEKRYEVAVWGAAPGDVFECGVALRRSPRVRRSEPRVIADPDHAAPRWPAATRFEVLVRGTEATLLRAQLATGRTHQIRAHCLILGLPVVGDPRYGDRARDRAARLPVEHQLLHARRLRMADEQGTIEISAEWPDPERTALEALGLRES